MSAGIKKEEWNNLTVPALNNILNKSPLPYAKLQEMFHIKKKGKYFEKNQMLGVFYFLYNESKPDNLNIDLLKEQKITHLLYIPKEVLLMELSNPQIKHQYKINDKQKNNINESHDSAFICLNVKNYCHLYVIP